MPVQGVSIDPSLLRNPVQQQFYQRQPIQSNDNALASIIKMKEAAVAAADREELRRISGIQDHIQRAQAYGGTGTVAGATLAEGIYGKQYAQEKDFRDERFREDQAKINATQWGAGDKRAERTASIAEQENAAKVLERQKEVGWGWYDHVQANPTIENYIAATKAYDEAGLLPPGGAEKEIADVQQNPGSIPSRIARAEQQLLQMGPPPAQKPLTEEEGKAYSQLQTYDVAMEDLGKLVDKIKGPENLPGNQMAGVATLNNLPGGYIGDVLSMVAGPAGRATYGTDAQLALNAYKRAVGAVLRAETGAGMNDKELEIEIDKWMPKAGEPPEVAKQKYEGIQAKRASLKTRAGAPRRVYGGAAPVPQAPAPTRTFTQQDVADFAADTGIPIEAAAAKFRQKGYAIQ